MSTVIQKKDKPSVAERQENKAAKFVRESYVEVFKKTSWPSRADLTKFTGVVLGTITIFALYLGALDFILTRLMTRLLR